MNFARQLPRSPDPGSEFALLSRRVSAPSPPIPPTPPKRRPSTVVTSSTASQQFSPRIEIYKSMLREIKNEASMYNLVHKASGILRLTQFKESSNARKSTVSWDLDGRRVVTYEDSEGAETQLLQRDKISRISKKGLLHHLNDPVFALEPNKVKVLTQYDADEGQIKKEQLCGLSKVWEHYIDTGDASTVLRSEEEIVSKNPSQEDCRHYPSKSSLFSDPRPSCKPPPPQHSKSSKFTPGGSSKISVESGRSVTPRESRSRSSTKTKSIPSKASTVASKDEGDKRHRVQHICIVNGTVVAFRNFGFENFTNWFGDKKALEANQARAPPQFHFEIDFNNVTAHDIKIRLVDNHRLEIVGYRHNEGRKRPLKLKECVIIPEKFRVEDLLICRIKGGKIVIEEVTKEPPAVPAAKKRLSKPSVKLKPVKKS